MNLDNSAISSDFVSVNGVNLHYLHSGKGAPIILLHGIPTYSYLWRNIIEPLSETGQTVIAPDFPGYGLSDKPMDAPYTLSYFIDVFNGFIDALGLKKISLVVHDLGGPVGLLWAIRNPERVEKIVILNTLARPHFSLSMNLLLWAARVPGLSNWISSPAGIAYTMKWGVYNRDVMTPDTIAAYQAPFSDIKARYATITTLRSIKPEQLTEISSQLVNLNKPIHIVCGENDSLLSSDMHQLQKDLPHASFISIKNCGHFIQEDRPRRIIEVLSVIFSQV